MMVADLGAVHHLLGADLLRRGHLADGGGNGGIGRNGSLHIVGEIPGIGAGIGAELFLIQGLEIVKGLLGGVAEDAVGVALEGSQVIEGGRFFGLLPALYRFDGGRLPLAGGGNLLGLLFFLIPLGRGGSVAHGKLDGVERLGLKRADLCLALHQQRQRRRHDAPHIQGAVIEDGEQSRSVDAHQPVGLGAAESGLMQAVILATGTEAFKTGADGRVLHAGNPQPLHGLVASGEVVGGAEDQLALAPSVAGVDDSGNILPAHKGFEDVKLCPLVPADLKAPRQRHDGQILIAPFGVIGVVGFGAGKLGQMSETP